MRRNTIGGLLAGAITIAAVVSAAHLQAQDTEAEAANGPEAEDESKFDYTVVDGQVDAGVMMGWHVYTGTCMACHGPDGLGSSFAPSLVRAAERRTFDEFAQTIAEGRDVLPGQVMPSFADDMRVMSHIGDIWNYLGARAEGALGRGRPSLLDAEGETDAEADGDAG